MTGKPFNIDKAADEVMAVLNPTVPKASYSNALRGLEVFDAIVRECRAANIRYISVDELADAVKNIRDNLV